MGTGTGAATTGAGWGVATAIGAIKGAGCRMVVPHGAPRWNRLRHILHPVDGTVIMAIAIRISILLIIALEVTGTSKEGRRRGGRDHSHRRGRESGADNSTTWLMMCKFNFCFFSTTCVRPQR